MKQFYTAIQSIIFGCTLAFAYPNIMGQGFFLFSIIAFALYYFFILKEQKLKMMLLHTFFFSLGFSSLGFYWIPQTLSTFGGIDLSLGYVASFFFALIVLPHLWPQTLFIFYLKKRKLTPTKLLIILTFSHVIFEQITPSQFPVWIGHSILTNNTLLPLTSYFGVGIYSLALILLALFIPHFIKNPKVYASPLIIGLLILVLDFILGKLSNYPTTFTTKSVNSINLRLVQANIGNFLKISSEEGELNSIVSVYDAYEKLSFSKDLSFDLLIWPETAIPTLFNTNDWQHENFNYYPNIKKIIDQLPPQAGFVFGGYDLETIHRQYKKIQNEFNTAFFYQDKKFETYYKIKLIPFGETLPFGSWNHSMARFFPGVSLFAQGSEFKSFTLKKENNFFHFITPICYELLDTFFIRKFLNSKDHVEFIANLTNDSWYGDTAEPWQHLFLTRWRALEFRRPIIRSTNTGITTVIDEKGNFSTYLPVNDQNILDITLNLHSHPITFYQTWGNLLLCIVMVILSLIYLVNPAFIKSWRRKTPNNN
jgi:apolipoprotein N-acyltransferase